MSLISKSARVLANHTPEKVSSLKRETHEMHYSTVVSVTGSKCKRSTL